MMSCHRYEKVIVNNKFKVLYKVNNDFFMQRFDFAKSFQASIVFLHGSFEDYCVKLADVQYPLKREMQSFVKHVFYVFFSDLMLESASKCPMLTECPFRAEQCQEDDDCSLDAVCCKSPCGKVCTKQLFTGIKYINNI